jgi:hypothetical protein
VVGIVPESVDLRLGLAASVAAALPQAAVRAVAVVTRWLSEDPAHQTVGVV